jgi:hypothetical protein
MDCSCEVPMDIDKCYTFQKFAVRKARKSQICCECSRIIDQKETYKKITDFTEGKFQHYSVCYDCLSVIEKFFTEGYYFTMVWELLEQHIREELIIDFPWSCLKDITKISRERICGIIEEIWNEWED